MNASSDSASPASRRALRTAAGTAALIVVVALLWWLGSGSNANRADPAASPPHSQSVDLAPSAESPSSPAATSTPSHSVRVAPSAGPRSPAPERVLRTLALIDADRWPAAANAPGTQGGRTFGNREGLLPRTGADGRQLRFQEWDVNPKKPGRGRDAERIVTADDGSAWYTLDHYRSFVRIRGPSQ